MDVQNGVFRKGHFRAAAILIVVSCSTASPDRGEETIDLRSDPPPAEDSYGSVAHAAPTSTTTDASVDAGCMMPENPSHISLRLPKAPKVEVSLMGGEPYPYPYTITEETDVTVVTLYLPQGAGMNIRARAVEEVGLENGQPVYEPLGPEVTFTVEPEAKLGTNELSFGSTHTTVSFSGNAQNALHLGETFLQGPVTAEFIDGQVREIMHGVFEAPEDMDCHVSWVGCEKVYSFLDGPPECRTAPFTVRLRAGQRLGLYPVVGQYGEAVRLDLESFLSDPEE